jgi:hypothetical protein
MQVQTRDVGLKFRPKLPIKSRLSPDLNEPLLSKAGRRSVFINKKPDQYAT